MQPSTLERAVNDTAAEFVFDNKTTLSQSHIIASVTGNWLWSGRPQLIIPAIKGKKTNFVFLHRLLLFSYTLFFAFAQ